MLTSRYESLIAELTSFILKHEELTVIKKDAEFDLKWRLTQLFKEVSEEDEQKFIELSGMQGHLITSAQKKEMLKREKALSEKKSSTRSEISELTEITKNTTNIAWAKSLYRRAVRRCHPDTIKVSDDSYKKELVQVYKAITESYENSNLDILMVESCKLFIKPKKVIGDQIAILESSKISYDRKIKDILASQGYTWSTFDDDLKENFLINLMKQQGVKFVDRSKVKEVLKRKISSRKPGQKPKNNLRDRIKNKKLSI